MMIAISHQATQDLDDIFDYIAPHNPAAALALEETIRGQIMGLLHNPYLGHPGRAENTRELVIAGTPYIVPYRVKNNRLEILRVYHAARQWPETL